MLLLGDMQQQDIPVWRAGSGAELRDLLRTDKRGLIISMIHKFDGIEKDANTRDNIYVFVDEAHRSVARDLGTYLMAALPNSTIMGFTGMPIARTSHGEGTFKIFGTDDDLGYLDKYTIAESIEDETTLPIRHTMAPSEMTVPAEQLDKEFFALAEMEGVTDVDELNSVLDRAVGLRTFLTADDRIEKVADFVAQHFQENVMPLGYKAFLVGVNREACAKYKQALDKLLPSEWSVPVYTKSDRDFVEHPLVAQLQLSEQAKVFNLVRGLQREIENDPEMGSVLKPLKARAEHILKDIEERTTTGLAAMDLLAALAKEKEAAVKSRQNSGLSPRAFGAYWTLKDDPDLRAARVNAMDLAREAESLLGRFPNAAVNADEERLLRAALYRPLLKLPTEGRSHTVKRLLTILLGTDVDVGR